MKRLILGALALTNYIVAAHKPIVDAEATAA